MQPTNQLDAELKAYVFAQYYGQKVYIHSTWQDVKGNEPFTLDSTLFNSFAINDGRLYLRPLSSIIDDEAIEVAKMAGISYDFVEENGKIEICRNEKDISVYYWVQTSYEYDEYDKMPFSISFVHYEFFDHMGCSNNSLSVWQYLQQQGFALPVFFKDTPYTVDQLTDKGIYLIK